MNIEITSSVLGLIGGFVGTGAFYIVIITARFTKIEAEVGTVKSFFNQLMARMIDLAIDMHTPELDKLLLAFRRHESMTETEFRRLHDLIEHEHVEHIRAHPEMLKDDPTRILAKAVILAGIEARRERQEVHWFRRLHVSIEQAVEQRVNPEIKADPIVDVTPPAGGYCRKLWTCIKRLSWD